MQTTHRIGIILASGLMHGACPVSAGNCGPHPEDDPCLEE